MSALHDTEAIKALMVDLLRDPPRGLKSDLARAAQVKGATVTKWAAGQVCPSPEHWPTIEQFFGLPEGRIAHVGGVAHVLSRHADDLADLLERFAKHVVEELDRTGQVHRPDLVIEGLVDSYLIELKSSWAPSGANAEYLAGALEALRSRRAARRRELYGDDANLEDVVHHVHLEDDMALAAGSGEIDGQGIDINQTHSTRRQADRDQE